MSNFSRSDWGARPARGGPGDLTPSRVEGIALHWPGMSRPVHGVAAVSAALRGWQNFHMDDREWSDIAYQEAVDQDGNSYTLRGLATQSGANGDNDTNERFGALLLVLAPGEQPTAAMVATVRARVAAHRALFRSSKRIVGHSQIRPDGTTCPGPIAQRLINDGEFEPTQEDDMPAYTEWPQKDRDALVADIVKGLVSAPIDLGDGKRRALKQVLKELWAKRNV